MVDEIIAKSYPFKTLKEHTEEVLNTFHSFKNISNKLGVNLSEEEWRILKLACFYHDFGKANFSFQQKIKGHQKLDKVSHNFISIAFVPEENQTLIKLIAFHHWRDFPDLEMEEIKQIYYETKHYLEKLKDYFNNLFSLVGEGIYKKRLEILKDFHSKRIMGSFNLKKESKFIFLLGLLNRIDHSTSAGTPMEMMPIDKFKKTKDFLMGKNLQPWQLKEMTKDLKRKNGIIVASTGMGKTEMALLWADYSKTFYTLPVRTSVNAMYHRLKNLFGESSVGLLHSEALGSLFLDAGDLSIDDAFYHYDMVKNLSYPLIVSTADQLFSATLKYFGFEKIYSTLSYSKVIIDEIQAYSPHTLAIMIQGLNEISSLGGKYLIVTATLPPFIKNYINFDFQIKKIPSQKKHNINMLKEELNSEIIKKLIKKLQRKGLKKILIVLNTVKKAQEIFKDLREFSPLLLHSRFTRIDRNFKEKTVLNENFAGILIATQVIEVSLDIDFDVLITELAPLDVLIQRMGRVFRRFKEDGDFSPSEGNVYIFTENPSGLGNIYENELVKKSKLYLKDGKISEQEKFQIINKFYAEENLKDTRYWIKFNNSLESIKYYSVNKKMEAQEIFREIAQINAIPLNLLEREVENERILKEFELSKISFKAILEKIKIKDKKDKIFLIELIKDFMVPLPIYRMKKSSLITLRDYVENEEIKDFLNNIFLVDFKYDNILGVLYNDDKF